MILREWYSINICITGILWLDRFQTFLLTLSYLAYLTSLWSSKHWASGKLSEFLLQSLGIRLVFSSIHRYLLPIILGAPSWFLSIVFILDRWHGFPINSFHLWLYLFRESRWFVQNRVEFLFEFVWLMHVGLHPGLTLDVCLFLPSSLNLALWLRLFHSFVGSLCGLVSRWHTWVLWNPKITWYSRSSCTRVLLLTATITGWRSIKTGLNFELLLYKALCTTLNLT